MDFGDSKQFQATLKTQIDNYTKLRAQMDADNAALRKGRDAAQKLMRQLKKLSEATTKADQSAKTEGGTALKTASDGAKKEQAVEKETDEKKKKKLETDVKTAQQKAEKPKAKLDKVVADLDGDAIRKGRELAKKVMTA